MIWTQPKRIGLIQNDWYLIKVIWTVQNHLRPIEGQGSRDDQCWTKGQSSTAVAEDLVPTTTATVAEVLGHSYG